MMPRPAASRKRKSLQRAKPVPNRIENEPTAVRTVRGVRA